MCEKRMQEERRKMPEKENSTGRLQKIAEEERRKIQEVGNNTGRLQKIAEEERQKIQENRTDTEMMRKIICEELRKTEKEEKIVILYAAESGSRAWGFASVDSDYDVRFIYRREKEYYLKLSRKRDVIELPICSELDINGWDLDKTLKLLHCSNPTLFEWCNSPIVYRTSDYFESFKGVVNRYFHSKSGLYHYLNMGIKNYRGYLKQEEVKLKKYFYVVRPILACRWILEFQTPPPMLFSELVESQADHKIRQIISDLLDLKKNAPETKMIPRIEELNYYIEKNLAELKEQVAHMPKEPKWEWDGFNQMFLDAFSESLY